MAKGKSIGQRSKNVPGVKSGLTPKQQKFAESAAQQMIETGDVVLKDAALEAGYSSKSISSTPSIVMAKDNVREHYLMCLEKAGVTDDKLAQVENEALGATKKVIINSKQGWVDEVPDHAIRLKAVDGIKKSKGMYAKSQSESTKKEQHLHVYANMTPEKLKKMNEKVNKDMSGLD